MTPIGLSSLNVKATPRTWDTDMRRYPFTTGMVVGTFLSNWLLVPTLMHHDYWRGFLTGVIASLLTIAIMPIIERKLR
jgi:hypothetical protein